MGVVPPPRPWSSCSPILCLGMTPLNNGMHMSAWIHLHQHGCPLDPGCIQCQCYSPVCSRLSLSRAGQGFPLEEPSVSTPGAAAEAATFPLSGPGRQQQQGLSWPESREGHSFTRSTGKKEAND